MAFTPTSLAITPLLESTFISDMRLIVNANTTLIGTQIEDVINNLQIDLVNKYIGTDSPVGKINTEEAYITNQLVFKAGTSGAASTIAQLTQSSGTSTFLVDNVSFTKSASSTAIGSKVATPTVVVGTDNSSIPVTFPTSGGAGIADRGLYVGDSTTPIKAGFYGEVEFAKQAVTQSVKTAAVPKEIQLASGGGDTYTYANLTLAKTDPQFIHLKLILPSGYTQTDALPIWLQLHESFVTNTSRPAVGQTFTLIISEIYQYGGVTPVATTDWPAIATLKGINIMPGWQYDAATSGTSLKYAYINSGNWTSVPTAGTSAVSSLAGGLVPKIWAQFFNVNIHSAGTSGSNKLGAAISITKTLEETNYSTYVITGGSNFSIVNA